MRIALVIGMMSFAGVYSSFSMKNYHSEDIIKKIEEVVDRLDVDCWDELDENSQLCLFEAYYELNSCGRLGSIFDYIRDIKINYGTNFSETYKLGMDFKKCQGPDFREKKVDSLRAAYQCFRYICKNSLEDLSNEDLEIIAKSYHQLGLLYYRYGRSRFAINCFDFATRFASLKESFQILGFIKSSKEKFVLEI